MTMILSLISYSILLSLSLQKKTNIKLQKISKFTEQLFENKTQKYLQTSLSTGGLNAHRRQIGLSYCLCFRRKEKQNNKKKGEFYPI